MIFFIENKAIDHTIGEIKRRLRGAMNGEVAAAMRKNGIVYKKNFGVEIPRIRAMSQLYTPNHDLAQRLWAMQIRETMILATLLQPAEKFTSALADRWLRSIRQPELAEQTCMNLFARLPYAPELALRWTASDALWEQIVGFTLTARVGAQMADEQRTAITERGVALTAQTDEWLLYRAIAVALSRFCRQGAAVADAIEQRVAPFENSEKRAEQFVFHEIQNELLFLAP